MTPVDTDDVHQLQRRLTDRDEDVDWLWSSGRRLGAQLSTRLAREGRDADARVREAVQASAAAESRAVAAEAQLAAMLSSETWAVGRTVLYPARYAMRRFSRRKRRRAG